VWVEDVPGTARVKTVEPPPGEVKPGKFLPDRLDKRLKTGPDISRGFPAKSFQPWRHFPYQRNSPQDNPEGKTPSKFRNPVG
jgi:hypothetical protein